MSDTPTPSPDPAAGDATGTPLPSGPPPPAPLPAPPYGQAGAAWPNSQPGPVGQYPGPYIPPVSKQGGSGKIVLIVLLVVLLVTCGGCLAVGGLMVGATRDVVREIDDYQPPTATARTTVEPGAAFEVGDWSFAPGWKVVSDGPVATVDGLVATPSTSDPLAIAVTLTFFKGDRELGAATCVGPNGGVAEDVTLECLVTNKLVRRADRVVVDSLL